MKINQLKSGVILSYVSLFLSNIISLFYTPLMISLLGASEHGLYNLVSSVISALGLFNFGFSSAYVRFFSRCKKNGDNEELARVNGTYIIIYTVLGCVAVLASIIMWLNIDTVFGAKLSDAELETAKKLFAIMTVNCFRGFISTIFAAFISANERFFFQKTFGLINSCLSPLIMICVLKLGFRSVHMALAGTVFSILCDLVTAGYCFKSLKMRFNFRNLSFSLIKEMWGFTIFIFLSMVADQLNWSVDKYVIGRVMGTACVSVYSVGATINRLYMAFSSGVSSVFTPKIYSLAMNNDTDGQNKLFFMVGRIQFFILMLIFSGFVFFGEYFIVNIWIRQPDYISSYFVAILLMAPLTIPLIQNLGIELLRAKNLHRFRSYVYLGIALVNVALTFPLCKQFGIIGSAAATSITVIIGNGLIMNVYYKRYGGLDIGGFWKQILKILPALIVPTVTGILINRFAPIAGRITFLLFVIVYTVVYFVSLWLFAFNRDEKEFFIKPFAKIAARRKAGTAK